MAEFRAPTLDPDTDRIRERHLPERLTESALTAAIDQKIEDAGIPDGAVTSLQVARIVAVMEGDPTPVLENGDMLIRYVRAGNLYSLTFSGTHVAAVTNLTKVSGANWLTVNSTTEAVGAENPMVLRITGTETYYAIPDLETDPYKDNAEILVRYRHSSATQHSPQFYFYADDTYDNGFYVSFTGSSTANGAAKVRHKVGATHNDIASVNIPVITSGQWVMMRARCFGNTLSFKAWSADTVEPTEWTVSASVTPPYPKRTAIGRTSNQNSQHFDWVAVATGGKTAVKE